MNSKLSDSLKGNKNAAKNYVREQMGNAGATAGGLAEKAKFSAAGAKVGFAFGGMLEKAFTSTTTTTNTGTYNVNNGKSIGVTSSSQKTGPSFEGTAAKMAIKGAKIGAKVADISPIGEIKGRQKAFNTFDRMFNR